MRSPRLNISRVNRLINPRLNQLCAHNAQTRPLRTTSAPSTPKITFRHGMLRRHLNTYPENHSLFKLPEEGTSQRQTYDLSLTLSRTPMNGNTEIRHTTYDSKGIAISTTKSTKHEIATTYGLSARDLRTLDLATTGITQILIRDNSILVHLFNLRLLIQADQLLLFHIDELDSHDQDNSLLVFTHDLESRLRHRVSTTSSMPYELRALETALASVTSTLEAEFLLASQKVRKALRLENTEEALTDYEPWTLLHLTRQLADIAQRARHVRAALQDVLNEDQDMADMHLTDKRAGKPHAVEDHQDVEYLLEAYFKASDTIAQEAASLIGSIEQTEGTIQAILDVRRNRIMTLEAKMEIIMLGFASATLVAGLYGMNVINYLEDNALGFGVLTATCLVSVALIWRYGKRQLKHVQKLPPGRRTGFNIKAV